MSILLIGSDGSMGKRYQVILKYLGKSFECIEKGASGSWISEMAYRSEGVIIATPTQTHLNILQLVSSCGKPILCEKPLATNEADLMSIMNEVKEKKAQFRMMLQYLCLDLSQNFDSPLSSYDYFRHGHDGLVWDCLQVIALARGPIHLNDQSPIWKCSLNGEKLNLSDMDRAYLDYVNLWLKEPAQDLSYLESIHRKTIDFEKSSVCGLYGPH